MDLAQLANDPETLKQWIEKSGKRFVHETSGSYAYVKNIEFIVEDLSAPGRLHTYNQPIVLSPSKKYCNWGVKAASQGWGTWVPVEQIRIVETILL